MQVNNTGPTVPPIKQEEKKNKIGPNVSSQVEKVSKVQKFFGEKIVPEVKGKGSALKAQSVLGQVHQVDRKAFPKASFLEQISTFFSKVAVFVREALANLSKFVSVSSEKVIAVKDQNPNIPEEKQVSLLEKEMVLLATLAENISNQSKNIFPSNFFLLNKGETPESAASQLIDALKEANQAQMTKFTYRGKTIETQQINQAPMKELSKNFQGKDGSIWKEALVDVFAAKQAALENKLYLAKPLLAAINQMKTQQDANEIGFFIMSEVCSTAGGTRKINMEKLKRVLEDPRIQTSPLLKQGVLNAAKDVTVLAIRKEQSNLIWDTVKDRPDRKLFNAWVDKESGASVKEEAHLDLQGIYTIAKRLKMKTAFKIDEQKGKSLESLNADLKLISQWKKG